MRPGRAVLHTLAGTRLLAAGHRSALLRAAGVVIGPRTRIDHGQLWSAGTIVIGGDCYLNVGCCLDPGDAEIVLADDVTVGPGATMMAVSHRVGVSGRRAGRLESERIAIGAGSWLGARVTVLPGVTVGPGCVVAAGAVLTRDTGPDGLYAGVPARRVRDLD